MKKYGLLNTIVLLFFSTISFASHLIGGETFYKYLGNDTYEFTFIYYRDCKPQSEGGGSPGALVEDELAYFSIYKGNDFYSIDSFKATSSEVIPNINSYTCLTDTPNLCSNKLTFKFIKHLPPSTLPYKILNLRCCLNFSISNIENAGSNGFSFICTIPPNISNNSAVFKPINNTVLCANKQYVIDHSADDIDGDFLTYGLCSFETIISSSDPKPQITNPKFPWIQNVNYKYPYTDWQPLNSVSIDGNTGQLKINPKNQGMFIVTVCCNEWRNNEIINQSKRSYTYTINNCNYEVMAKMKCDTILEKYTNENQCYTNCQSKTILFESNSVGANNIHWDFGVPNTDDDTSNIAKPTFTYPSNGNYEVKLFAYGQSCNDTLVKKISIGTDSIITDFTNTEISCTGKSIYFTDSSTSNNNILNKWQWIFNSPTKEILSEGKYTNMYFYEGGHYKTKLISFNNIGCYSTKEKEFDLEKINVVAYSDTTIPIGTPLNIYATGTTYYAWDFNGVNTILSGTEDNQYPTINFNNIGKSTYTVLGGNTDGCAGSDTISVLVTSNDYFIVPTAFSPNKDSKNDKLKMMSSGYTLQVFRIYNRRGQQVFATNNLHDNWDGNFKNEPMGIDTYYWQAIVKDNKGQFKVFKGDVTLVR